VKRTVKADVPGGKRAPEPDGAATCKYNKVQLPNVRPGEIDVDAVIRALESRNAAKRTVPAAEPPPAAIPEPAPAGDAAASGRMPDTDLEEIARVLKMTRSAAAAREWGLRLLVETKRARDAEKRLSGKA
jgi:hypothetical protein